MMYMFCNVVLLRICLTVTVTCILYYRHTGIVIYGKEYFFGSGGIEYCPPVCNFHLYFAVAKVLYCSCSVHAHAHVNLVQFYNYSYTKTELQRGSVFECQKDDGFFNCLKYCRHKTSPGLHLRAFVRRVFITKSKTLLQVSTSGPLSGELL